MENEFPCVLSLPHIIFIPGIGGTDRRYRLQRVIETIEHYDPDILFYKKSMTTYLVLATTVSIKNSPQPWTFPTTHISVMCI